MYTNSWAYTGGHFYANSNSYQGPQKCGVFDFDELSPEANFVFISAKLVSLIMIFCN